MTITTEPARTTAGSDFAVLSRRVAAEGLMTRRPAYYAVRLPIVALMLAGGWTAFFLLGSSWWQLAVAVWLAIGVSRVARLMSVTIEYSADIPSETASTITISAMSRPREGADAGRLTRPTGGVNTPGCPPAGGGGSARSGRSRRPRPRRRGES